MTGVTGAAVGALTGGNANAAGLINGNSGGGASSLGGSLGQSFVSNAASGLVGNGLLAAGGSTLLAGSSLGAFATGAGTALVNGAGIVGNLSAAGSLMGTGTMSGFMSGLGMAMPYLAAVLAIVSIVAGMGKGGTPHAGAVVFGGEGGASFSPSTQAGIDAFYADPRQNQQFHESDFTKRYNADVAKALTPLATGLADSFNAITRKYGAGSGYKIGLGFSSDGEDKSRGRFSILDAAGREISDFLRKFSSDASKGMEQFGLAAQQGLLQGLRELDLGREVNAVLDKSLQGSTDYLTKLTQDQTTALLGLLDTGLLDDLVKNVDLAALSFDDLNARIAQLAKISSLKPLFDNLGVSIVEVGVDIVAAMGSIENASNAMQAYYAAFYTDSERLGIAQSQLAEQFKALNERTSTGPISGSAPAAFVRGIFDPDIQTMRSISDRLTPKMREPGSGATSDFDARMFQSALFGVNKNPESNRAIADAMILKAKAEKDRVSFMESYLAQNNTLRGADSAWTQYAEANPIFDPKETASFGLNKGRVDWQTWFRNAVDPQTGKLREGGAPGAGVMRFDRNGNLVGGN